MQISAQGRFNRRYEFGIDIELGKVLHWYATGMDIEDPRGMVEQILDATRLHRIPDHAPTRAIRVLETAAHIDAIITVSTGLTRIGTQSLSEAQIATDALRPLAAVVRSARMAALSAIQHAAWQG